MPLNSYGVLVGTVTGRKPETGTDTPHYQILVHANGVDYRVAVNVRSAQSPPDLLYVALEDFAHPLVTALNDLQDGLTAVPSGPGGVALDYIRGNLFDRTAMRPLPADVPGPDNDLSDKIDHFVGRAMNDSEARLYAFGQRWGPEPDTADKIFGFRPGNGIHDIHMNQGALADSPGTMEFGRMAGCSCTIPRRISGSRSSSHFSPRPGTPMTRLVTRCPKSGEMSRTGG